ELAEVATELGDELASQVQVNADLRALAEERDRALADLAASLRTRDDFLFAAAHDLKNPLASIILSAQVVKRRCDQGAPLDRNEVRAAVMAIQSSALRMSGMVNELLDAARLRAGVEIQL